MKYRTRFPRCQSRKIGECDTLSPGHLTRASPVSQSVSAKLRPSSQRWLRGRLERFMQHDTIQVSLTYSVTHSLPRCNFCSSVSWPTSQGERKMTNLRRAVLSLPRGGVGAVRNRRIPGCGQTGTMLWGGPCYFAKNNEGGAKHQEGLHGSPASCRSCSPCVRRHLRRDVWEHKRNRVRNYSDVCPSS